MWAGGELEWFGKGLRVGDKVKETTTLVSAVGKKTRAGEEMVVVGVEKKFENQHGVALIDKRYGFFFCLGTLYFSRRENMAVSQLC